MLRLHLGVGSDALFEDLVEVGEASAGLQVLIESVDI